MFLRRIYDEGLAQAAYLIGCQRSGEAIVIDPERDVDRYGVQREAPLCPADRCRDERVRWRCCA